MLLRLFEHISSSVVRYQRIFFVIMFVAFIVLLLVESQHNFRFSPTYLAKKQSRKSATFAPFGSGGQTTDRPVNVSGVFHTGSSIQREHHKGGHFIIDPLQSKTEPEVRGRPQIHEDKTEVEIAKHWQPSADQMKALSEHHIRQSLDFEAEDILVFMHIPKTSGKTFNKHLVIDMEVPEEIRCRCKTLDKPHGCKCLNSDGYIWLFSRLTTAWPCGVHPSWSDLSLDCLNHAMSRKEGRNRKRKFTIVTILRSPYTRYISEWHNIQEHGQWKPFQNLRCYPLTRENFCYEDNWVGVTLDQFLDCPNNPGNNRQVRMLADLHMANCSQILEWLDMPEIKDEVQDISKRYQYIINNPLLRSAIHNLKHLTFFGLEEHQRESEYLFTRTFGYTFKSHFRQAKTFSEQVVISRRQRERILDLNRLDLVFYRYARELFFKRLHENVKRKHLFLADNVDFTTEATLA